MNVPPLGAVVPSLIQPGAPAVDGKGGFATFVVPDIATQVVGASPAVPPVSAPAPVALGAVERVLLTAAAAPTEAEATAPPVSKMPPAALAAMDRPLPAVTAAAGVAEAGAAEIAPHPLDDARAAEAGRAAAMVPGRLVFASAVVVGAASEAVDANPAAGPDPSTPQRPGVPPGPAPKERPQADATPRRWAEKRAGEEDIPASDKSASAVEPGDDEQLEEPENGVGHAVSQSETRREATPEVSASSIKPPAAHASRRIEHDEIVDKPAPDTQSNTLATARGPVIAASTPGFRQPENSDAPISDALSVPGTAMPAAALEPKMSNFVGGSTPEAGDARASKSGENVSLFGQDAEVSRFAAPESPVLQGAPLSTGELDAEGVPSHRMDVSQPSDGTEAASPVPREPDARAPISPQIMTPETPRAAPSVAPPPQTAHPTPHLPIRAGQFGGDLGVEISRRIVSGSSETVVRLDPVDMGRIDVRMSLDADNTLKLVVSADNSSVLDLLRRESGDLLRALSDAGIRSDSQHLRFDSQGSSTSQQWQGSGQGGGERRGRQPQRWFEEQPSTTSRHAIAGGRVDLMA